MLLVCIACKNNLIRYKEIRDETDCCQLAMSVSLIKYTELKNRGPGSGYPIHLNERRIKNIELSVRR